jgi:hypothetical protein
MLFARSTEFGMQGSGTWCIWSRLDIRFWRLNSIDDLSAGMKPGVEQIQSMIKRQRMGTITGLSASIDMRMTSHLIRSVQGKPQEVAKGSGASKCH